MIFAAENLHREERTGERLGTLTKLLEEPQMHGKAKLFARILLKPGSQAPMHQHSGDFEAYYILQGQGMVNDNGIMREVKTGDVVFTDDGESHSIKNTSNMDLEYIALIINTK